MSHRQDREEFTLHIHFLRIENAGFSSWRQLEVTTCGYYPSFAWRPAFYSLAVVTPINKGICLGQRVLNLDGFDNISSQTVFHFPNHTSRPRHHHRSSFCSKQGHIFLAEIKWYVMTLFPLRHQFLAYCTWKLSEQFNRNFTMWVFFSFLKMMYLSFLLKDLNGGTPEKNYSFPKTGVSYIVIGDIATLTVQLRVQLATLHSTGQGFLASVHFIQRTRAPKSISLLQTLKKNTIDLLPKPFKCRHLRLYMATKKRSM